MINFQTKHLRKEVKQSAAEPRRRLDTEVTPGKCGNLDYCSIGMQRILLKVPLSQPFVCPECGSALRAPLRKTIVGRPLILPALRLAVLVTAMGVSLATGYAIGRVQHRVGAAVTVASASLGADLHAARTMLGLVPPPPAPAALPIFVAERPYPARLPSVDVSRPAPRLPAEARFGQVTLDCLLDAELFRPSCQVTDIRGADAFSAAAVVWLQGLAVRYGPGRRGGVAVPLAHRWRVVFEDFGGVRPAGKAPGQ